MSLKALFYPCGTKKKPIPFESLYIPYIYKEIYFDQVYNNCLVGKKDLTILDIGANIGVVTQFLRNYGAVYAVEPSGEHFEALKKNKEFNKWDNVEVFNIALADKDGEMTLNKLDSNLTCNSLTNDYHNGGEKVKTMAFDSFMDLLKLDKVDFCKFDVEGAEDMILRSEGFKKVCTKIKSIEIEFHYQNWKDLVDYLISLGYQGRRVESSAIICYFQRTD
jgi:FkbM family methyltransferase